MSSVLAEDFLTIYAKDFLQANFNLKLTVPIQTNNRLRSTLGRFVVTRSGKPLRIELSARLLNYGTDDVILGVLRHELLHYAFFVQGKNYQDGDPVFEEELKRYRAPSTRTLKVGKYYQYRCIQCNQTGETNVKRIVKKPDEYRSNCCHSPIEIIGEQIYRGFI